MTRVSDLCQISWAEEFLARPLIARLATCDPDSLQPHAVPVWFEWDGSSIWISSFRSTRKVREIQKNPRVSLVVDTDPAGGNGHTVIFEGNASLIFDSETGIRRGAQIYSRYLGPDGARMPEPQSWLHDPEHLLIHILPKNIYVS